MPLFNILFNKGLVTSRDRAVLSPGELVGAEGIYYRHGDTMRAHKIPGRTAFDTVALTGTPKGLALCQFDTGGTDVLVAAVGTTLQKATPGLTGTFASLDTGYDSSATLYTFAHAFDRWYIGNGYDRNKVLKPDATLRSMGMEPPDVKPVVAVSTAAIAGGRPATSGNGSPGYTDVGEAIDTPTGAETVTSTFAYAKRSTAGSNTAAWYAWPASTAANRQLTVIWSVGNPNVTFSDYGTGGTRNLGAKVTVLIEYTLDNSAPTPTYATLAELDFVNQAPDGFIVSTVAIPAASNSDKIQVRTTFTYHSGSKGVVHRIYDIRIKTAEVANFTTTTGMYYAFTEYDRDEGKESPPSIASDLVTLATQNLATINNLPGTAEKVNSTATHYRIYRTIDGGQVPQGLGMVDEIPIQAGTGSPAVFSWTDQFVPYDKDTLPERLVPQLTVRTGEGLIRVYRDTPPPAFQHMNFYKGSIVGISRTQPRVLFYSFAGRPESFPSIYVIDTFPLPEHDELVASVTVGDTLLIAAKDVMIALDELPRVVQNIFNTTEVRPLRGMPGAVGINALTAFSVRGEPMAAWVSKFGVHMTNGVSSVTISKNIDWQAADGLGKPGEEAGTNVFLFYDKSLEVLFVHVDTNANGVNDAFYMIHLAPEHRLDDGQPKWTGPHYYYQQFVTAGIVGGTYRRYAINNNDNKVYVEFNGYADNSRVNTDIDLRITTGRFYFDHREAYCYKGILKHSAFGAGEEMVVTWVTGRDAAASSTEQSRATTISLLSNLGSQFYVGLQGEYHELRLTHASTVTGSLTDVRAEVRETVLAGRIA